MSEPTLPIEHVIPDILDALESAGRAVLQAPPGAGKTTRVPPALLDAGLAGDGQELDRHLAPQVRVAGAVDHAHAPPSQLLQQLVACDGSHVSSGGG